MWKWLRNLVLFAIVLAGALKLAAWYAVGQDAQRVVAALAPWAEIKFDGLSAGLDGSVTVSGVSVAPKGAHRIYRADTATFDSPGLIWLLKHALLHENTLPAQFGISLTGLALPPEPWLDPLWLDPTMFAVFPSAGCASHLGANDYRRMGIDVSVPSRERFEYRYDAGQHTLAAKLDLSAPGFAGLALEADLSRFDPSALLKPGFWKATRVDQISATYTDNGFASHRNGYCAKNENLAPAQFADRHIAAVEALSRKARIQPGDEVVQLYRNLVTHGGSLRLLSLPNAAFSVDSWDSTSRDDLLRQLNVTARYQDKPPIMFRLAFLPAPEPALPPPLAEPAAATAATPPVPSAEPAPATPAPTPTPAAIASTPAPAMASSKQVTPTSQSTPAAAPAAATAAAPKAADTPTSPKPSATRSAAGPEDFFDRAEAKLAPPAPPPEPVHAVPEIPAAPLAPTAPSAPMPANATQALVWRPGVIEQLPEAAPVKKDYTVVEFSRLPQLAGRHVRLVTLGGKQVEGFVDSSDDNSVNLRIERGGGSALIAVHRDRIAQVQLLDW